MGTDNAKSRRAALVVLACILVLAAALRIHRVTERSLWFDEAVSVLIGLSDAGGALRAADAEKLPPLYNLTLVAFFSGFRGEAAARLLSGLFGLLNVVFVYLAGRELHGRRAGLVAATLAAAAGFAVWYSQEIRVYALQSLLVTGSCLWMLRLLRTGSRGDLLVYAAMTAGSLYAQYSSLFVLAFQNLYFFLAWRDNRERLRIWIAAQALVLLLFSPWIPAFARHLTSRSGSFWLPPLTAKYLLGHFYNFTGGLQSRGTLNAFFAWTSLAVLILAAAAVLMRRDTRKAGLFALLWFWVPTALLAAVSLGQNIFLSRALLYTLPAFCLLAGLAIGPNLERSLRAAVAALALAGLLAADASCLVHYYGDPNWWIKPPHRENARRVAALARDGDLVVHTSRFTYRPYQFYIGSEVPMCLLRETEDLPGLFAVIGRSDPPKDASGVARIWLVAYADFQQKGLHARVAKWMQQHHRPVRVLYRDRNNFVALLERGDGPLLPEVGP